MEFKLSRQKDELKLEEERRKNELKQEERLKNELKQQIKKCEALCKLELDSVQCEVWSESGSIKFSKSDTACRPKIEVPFAICTAEHNTKSTYQVKEKLRNVFKSDIKSSTQTEYQKPTP